MTTTIETYSILDLLLNPKPTNEHKLAKELDELIEKPSSVEKTINAEINASDKKEAKAKKFKSLSRRFTIFMIKLSFVAVMVYGAFLYWTNRDAIHAFGMMKTEHQSLFIEVSNPSKHSEEAALALAQKYEIAPVLSKEACPRCDEQMPVTAKSSITGQEVKNGKYIGKPVKLTVDTSPKSKKLVSMRPLKPLENN